MTWICRAAAVIVPALWVLAIWTVSPAAGQPAAEGPPARSNTKPPSWVDIVDLGALDKRLTGLSAPRGVRVEIVGEHAALNHLAGLAFADSGELYVLSWIPAVACDISAIEIQYRGGVRKAVRASKKTRDQLVALRDENSDGIFDSSRVLMADLELPSGLCLHDGWIYLAMPGRLVRRQPHSSKLLGELQASATAGTGPPTTETADGRWIEQQLAQGVNSALTPCGGTTIAADGWLYLSTAGNQPVRLEGWDGSRADVLASGGVFQMHPDGSRVREFGRGLGSPTGPTFDEDGNAFIADQFRAAPEVAAQGRLINLLAGGDYGFRRSARLAAAPPSLDCVGDEVARAGTLAPLLPLGGAAPFNLLSLDSTAFPEVFRGLLLGCDRQAAALRAWNLKREGTRLVVSAQFDLLDFGTSPYQLAGLAQGPDGAIYVAGRQTSLEDLSAPSAAERVPGRILRLSWGGTETMPATPLQVSSGWAAIPKATDDELWKGVDSLDGQIRQRSAQELRRRAAGHAAAVAKVRRGLTDRMQDATRPTAVRIGAISAVGQELDASVYDALIALFQDEHTAIRTAALNAIGDHPPADAEAVKNLAEAVQAYSRFNIDTPSERAWRLALAKLAAAGNYPSAEWGFESASVSHLLGITPYSFDAHVRALELIPGAASDLMVGNLEVALFLPEAEPQERQRLKEFVTLTAESMRTRELAKFLDDMLRSELDIFAKLDAPLEQRLIATYRNVEVDPPIHCDALLEWIEKHPGGPAGVDVAALETIVAVGTTKPKVAEQLAGRLLETPEDAHRIRVIQAVGRGRMTSLAKTLLSRLQSATANDNERRAIEAALAQLKQN